MPIATIACYKWFERDFARATRTRCSQAPVRIPCSVALHPSSHAASRVPPQVRAVTTITECWELYTQHIDTLRRLELLILSEVQALRGGLRP